jgi:hypothetical protein
VKDLFDVSIHRGMLITRLPLQVLLFGFFGIFAGGLVGWLEWQKDWKRSESREGTP